MGCSICNGTRHIRQSDGTFKRCVCIGTLRAEQALRYSNLPDSLRKVSLESFDTDRPQHRRFMLFIKELTQKENTSYLSVISTPNIQREKFSAVLALVVLSLNESYSTLEYQQLDNIVSIYFSKEKYISDADVLILQLGNEQTNSAHSSILYDIIYNRLLDEKYTIISTSLPEAEFIKIYSQRTFNLIKQNGSYLTV